MSNPEMKSKRSEEIQKLITRWLAYGVPNIDRVLECTEQRATVLGFGDLSHDEAHIFDLPLPPSLESKVEWRRITVTMAYNTPINPRSQKYRQASLWFELLDSKLVPDRSDAQWQTVKRGTVQHEVFVGDKADFTPMKALSKSKLIVPKTLGKSKFQFLMV
jgi:hypothetical protein